MSATLQIALPDNLTLDTSRVGQELPGLGYARVGETIRFWYEGGNESDYRTVLVVKQENHAIEGLTLERDGGYRRYLSCNVDGYVVVHDPFVENPNVETLNVRFDEAAEKLIASLSGPQLAELYNKHVAVRGIGATFDETTGNVVVKLPKPTAKFGFSTQDVGDKRAFQVTNKKGENLIACYNESSGQKIWLYGKGHVTPEQFLAELTAHLA